MLRYKVVNILNDKQMCEILSGQFVKAVVGQIQLLRRLSFKREFFVPFIPTKYILLLFPTYNPLQGFIVRTEIINIISTYLNWLSKNSGQTFNLLGFFVCSLSGCVSVIIDCVDVLSALDVHSSTQDDSAPSIGNRRVIAFPCDKEELSVEKFREEYYIVPTCTICAERLEPTLTGYTSRVCCCSRDNQCTCLMEQSSCFICQTIIKMQRERNGIQCEECKISGDPWICVTCGFIGCSRYQRKHAREHFLKEGHVFSMSLLTQQIWDYDSDAFVHRVVVSFDNETGVTHRVQYPDRDNIPTSLEEDDDTGDLCTEKTKKKHINAKYDSEVEMSNEKFALMIKDQLDIRRAEYESEQQQQQEQQKQNLFNFGKNISNNEFSIYNMMNNEKMYGTHRLRWLSLFLANQSLKDEVEQRKYDVINLEQSLNELQCELRSVVQKYVTKDSNLTGEITELQETIKEIELNLKMRNQLSERLGEDEYQRICLVGGVSDDGSNKNKKKKSNQKKQSSNPSK